MSKPEVIGQEFYCNDCNGYNLFSLPKAYSNSNIEVVCGNPACDRKHPRSVRKGQIVDNVQRRSGKIIEIVLMPSAYSKEPRTEVCKRDARDSAIIKNPEVDVKEKHRHLVHANQRRLVDVSGSLPNDTS